MNFATGNFGEKCSRKILIIIYIETGAKNIEMNEIQLSHLKLHQRNLFLGKQIPFTTKRQKLLFSLSTRVDCELAIMGKLAAKKKK